LKNANCVLNSSDQVSDQVVAEQILDFCNAARSKKEICEHLGYRNLTYFTRKYLAPLVESGKLKLTLPDKPKSQNQKYVRV
jgi:ATP-dependent DNA helicase RecG